MISKRKQSKPKDTLLPQKWVLVVVDWVDAAFGENHDFAAGEVLEPIELRTVGFIVAKTKKYITLAGEYNPEDGSTRHQYTILTANVKKMKTVVYDS